MTQGMVAKKTTVPIRILNYTWRGDPSILTTVCPGSSDPPEKILNIFASENEVYTIF